MPRNPQATDYYRCVEDHLETFIQVYEDRFERTYGFIRPYLRISGRSFTVISIAATRAMVLPG